MSAPEEASQGLAAAEVTGDSPTDVNQDTPSDSHRKDSAKDTEIVSDVKGEDEEEDESIPWKYMTPAQKRNTVLIGILRTLMLLACLYFFFCALKLLGSSFKLAGGRAATRVFRSKALSNPVAGLMIGLLATVLVQSSSTSTSIIVTLASDTSGIPLSSAVFMIFGANIGTTVTNTLVSLSQADEPTAFRRAFAGSTVHDFFNLLSVLVLLPIEAATQYLRRLTGAMVTGITKGGGKFKTIGVIIDPVTDLIIKVDSSQIKKGNVTGSLVKGGVFKNTGLSDGAVGGICLAISLVCLIASLLCLVKLLNHVLKGRARKMLSAALSMNGYLAILVGAGVTFLVQSSSITTSTLVPLCGLGVVTVEKMYPLTLGANLGTTGTAMLAAFSTGEAVSVQIAFVHLFFNISGLLLFFVIPVTRKIPIGLAKGLGAICAERRYLAIVYLVLVFMVIPGSVFALSLAGTTVFAAVLGPVFAIATGWAIFFTIRHKRPDLVPAWCPGPLQPSRERAQSDDEPIELQVVDNGDQSGKSSSSSSSSSSARGKEDETASNQV